MLGSKISDTLENNSFVASCMHLKVRRKRKEDYGEVGESQAELGLQDS